MGRVGRERQRINIYIYNSGCGAEGGGEGGTSGTGGSGNYGEGIDYVLLSTQGEKEENNNSPADFQNVRSGCGCCFTWVWLQ